MAETGAASCDAQGWVGEPPAEDELDEPVVDDCDEDE